MLTLAVFLLFTVKTQFIMRRLFTCILTLSTLIFSASTCEKMEPGDYHDFAGAKINLLGSWVLSEVQYKTAGVIETHPCIPESVMEFASKGIGYTKTISGDLLDTWHYETYRAAVTIFTNAEWENNRGLGEDDSQYEKGKTYYFHVLDDNTISSEEKVSSNTYITNIYTRFNSYEESKSIADQMYSPNTLIIMYDTEIGKEPLLAAIKEYQAEIIYDYSIIPGMAIRIPDGANIHVAIAYFKTVKGVVSVERDQIIRLTDPVKPHLEFM